MICLIDGNNFGHWFLALSPFMTQGNQSTNQISQYCARCFSACIQSKTKWRRGRHEKKRSRERPYREKARRWTAICAARQKKGQPFVGFTTYSRHEEIVLQVRFVTHAFGASSYSVVALRRISTSKLTPRSCTSEDGCIVKQRETFGRIPTSPCHAKINKCYWTLAVGLLHNADISW